MFYIRDDLQVERRRAKRVNFDGPIAYHLRDTNSMGGCLARDISTGGLKVLWNKFIAPRTVINVSIRLSNYQEPVCIPARIAWTQKVPYSDMYYAGLQFQQANLTLERRIRFYVQSHLI